MQGWNRLLAYIYRQNFFAYIFLYFLEFAYISYILVNVTFLCYTPCTHTIRFVFVKNLT